MKYSKFDQLIKKFRASYWRLLGVNLGKGTLVENRLNIRGAKNITIGKNSYISDSVALKSSGGKIEIGDNALIRDGVKIQGGSEPTSFFRAGKSFAVNHNSSILFGGGIEIGDYVMIAPNVTITSGGHSIDRDLIMMKQESLFSKVIIEDDVWIGSNSVILPGVKLAKGTVVGAGSVVTKDSEPFSIIAGVPAKIIKYRK